MKQGAFQVSYWRHLGVGLVGSSGSGSCGVIWEWDAHSYTRVVTLYPFLSLQRWNQRLITLEDGKLLVSKDALVSHVLNGSL